MDYDVHFIVRTSSLGSHFQVPEYGDLAFMTYLLPSSSSSSVVVVVVAMMIGRVDPLSLMHCDH